MVSAGGRPSLSGWSRNSAQSHQRGGSQGPLSHGAKQSRGSSVPRSGVAVVRTKMEVVRTKMEVVRTKMEVVRTKMEVVHPVEPAEHCKGDIDIARSASRNRKDSIHSNFGADVGSATDTIELAISRSSCVLDLCTPPSPARRCPLAKANTNPPVREPRQISGRW